MMWGSNGMNLGWWFIGMFVVVIVTALIVGVVWLLAHGRGSSPTGTPFGKTPAQKVLDERYARGDVTTEEYRERMTNLGP